MAPMTDISLRHLPDDSQTDSSLSFQIPLADSSADLLLADNNDDFLKDDEYSFTTPAPRRMALDEPLTLSQLTPTLRVASTSATQAPTVSPQLHRPRSKSPEILSSRASPKATPMCTPKHAPQSSRKLVEKAKMGNEVFMAVDSPVSAERFANLKAEVDTLVSTEIDLEATQSWTGEVSQTQSNTAVKLPNHINPKTKPTIAAGGVTKIAKNKLPRSNFTRDVNAASRQIKPTRLATQKMIRPTTIKSDKKTKQLSELGGDEGNSSVGATGGAAGRLMMYGAKLMTDGLFAFANVEDRDHEAPDSAMAEEDVPSLSNPSLPSIHQPNEDPFTLSQLSPRKEEPSSQILPKASIVIRSPTPTRLAKRRIAPTAPVPPLPKHLKSKTDVPAPTRRSSKSGAPILQPSTRRNVTASSSTLPSNPKRKTRPGPRINKAPAVAKEKEKESPANFSSLSSSQRVGPSDHRIIRGNQTISKSTDLGTSSTHRIAKHMEIPPVPQRPINPTKPIEFTFRSDARLAARKAEAGEKLSTSEAVARAKLDPLPIPDFKTLHETELKASIAFRKEHVVPTIPITPDLNTKSRAKEREKFDDLIKLKEEEMNREREERRRVREEEEAREVKELRKRTIPKAHDVPEWYADAPKRSGSVHS